MWNVKEAVAHQALAAREPTGRLLLPAEREPWAKEQAESLAGALLESGYHVVGDTAELVPRPVADWTLQPAHLPAVEVLDAAVQAASALVVNHYRKAYPAARPQGDPDAQRGFVGRVESTVASSPLIKRTVRELSSRSRAVRRLRIAAWRLIERRRPESGR